MLETEVDAEHGDVQEQDEIQIVFADDIHDGAN
jgi:hypothetical protein